MNAEVNTLIDAYQSATSRSRNDGLSMNEHNHLIWETITLGDEKVSVIAPDAFKLAVNIHDVVSDLISGNQIRQQSATLFINHLLNQTSNNRDVYIALGFASSAEFFESEAESWRGNVIDSLKPDTKDTFMLEDVESIAKELTLDQDYVANGLSRAISDKKFTTSDPKLVEAIYRFRAPMADFERTMLNALKNNDIEGLVIKAAEVMNNIEHPNEKRQFSAWRDAQELLSFYGPMLEMAGLDEYASKVYDIALQHLNKDRTIILPGTTDRVRVIDVANYINARARSFIEAQGETLENLLKPFGNKLVPGNVWMRVKSIGRITQKILEKDFESANVPDAIGVRVILSPILKGSATDQAQTALAISERIQNYYNTVNGQGYLVPEHTREGEPHIEIHYNGGEADESIREAYANKGVSLNEARKSGLQTIHTNFKTFDNIGIEIQAMFKNDRRTYNEKGSHVLYVASERSFGHYGRLKRALKNKGLPEPRRIQIEGSVAAKINIFVSTLKEFQQRAHDFRIGFANNPDSRQTGLSIASAKRLQSFLRSGKFGANNIYLAYLLNPASSLIYYDRNQEVQTLAEP